jgi:hypothetical protein
MAEASDRIQDALAAYLDYLELGGQEPDTSHLTTTEEEELKKLIDALESTKGVAFGHGRSESIAHQERAPVATTQEGELLISKLRESLPPGVRIETDPNRLVSQIGGIEIVDRWVVGTFGGRVRVWLMAVDAAQAIEQNTECLADLSKVFGMFPDAAAVALVGRDLSCLIVEPEDAAPQIQAPSGSMMSRRYKRAIQPVAEALLQYLDELIPYWDPIPTFDRDAGLQINVAEFTGGFVTTAIQNQRGIGERARKGNPKKDALLTLGMKETTALTNLANGLFDGKVGSDEIETQIERLAKGK